MDQTLVDRLRAVPLTAAALVAVLIVCVGWLDLTTGSEVRILAVYFVPLLVAGWCLGEIGAALSAVLAAIVWLGVLYADGTQFHASYVWVVNGLTEGSAFVLVAVLVARLRQALTREALLSRTDQLTGLCNRRAMTEMVTRELAICRRHPRAVSMICIDLNNFKRANDRYGHLRGDELLRQCALMLKRTLRSVDTIARIGGDEFAIFLPETNAEQAALLVDRIRLAADAALDSSSTGVTLSIGAYSEAPVVSDLDGLLQGADARMYEAKRLSKAAEGSRGH